MSIKCDIKESLHRPYLDYKNDIDYIIFNIQKETICQLEKDHIGAHRYSYYNGKDTYSITW